MEIIILVMAPLMVVLMVEVHAYASYNLKNLSLTALLGPITGNMQIRNIVKVI